MLLSVNVGCGVLYVVRQRAKFAVFPGLFSTSFQQRVQYPPPACSLLALAKVLPRHCCLLTLSTTPPFQNVVLAAEPSLFTLTPNLPLRQHSFLPGLVCYKHSSTCSPNSISLTAPLYVGFRLPILKILPYDWLELLAVFLIESLSKFLFF